MNYQQQPPPPPPPGYGQYPQQGYPPPPQQPQYQPPAQGYGQYPQPGYGQPPQAPPQQPQGPPPSLADYYSQPKGGGGPAVKFSAPKQVGYGLGFIIARDVTEADLEQQTNPVSKQLEFYPDGRRKIQLKVPLIVDQTPEHPEGRATLYAKTGIREALDAGMLAAGLPPKQFPKEGDRGSIVWVGTQPIQGQSDKKLFEVQYTPGPKWANAPAGSNGQAQQVASNGRAQAPANAIPPEALVQPNQAPPPSQPAGQATPPPPPPQSAAMPQQTPPPPPQVSWPPPNPPQPTAQGNPPPPPPPPNPALRRPDGMTDDQAALFDGVAGNTAPPGQAPPQ